MYDVYLAIEGHQPLYSSSGIFEDMLELKDSKTCCLLTDLMDEAETAWKSVLKKETIGTLLDKIHTDRFRNELENLQMLMKDKVVV